MHAHRLQFHLQPQSPAPVANVTTVKFNLPMEVIMQMSLHEVHNRKICQRRPCMLTGYHIPLPCSLDMSCNTIGLLMPEQTSDMTRQVLRCGAPGNHSQDTVEHKNTAATQAWDVRNGVFMEYSWIHGVYGVTINELCIWCPCVPGPRCVLLATPSRKASRLYSGSSKLWKIVKDCSSGGSSCIISLAVMGGTFTCHGSLALMAL